MNIGMILGAAYPPDIRITKEAQALQVAGHQVFLLCQYKPNSKEPETEEVDGITVRRLKVANSLYELAFWDSLNALRFRHPLFAPVLPGFIKEYALDALHVHDLPLANTVLQAGRKAGLPVVVDFHENYAEGLKVWASWKKHPIVQLKNALFFGYNKWTRYEGRMAHAADRVITVVDEMRDRMVAVHGVPQERITVITNTESRNFSRFEDMPHIYGEALQGKFLLTYTGGIGPHRGVDTMLEGMAYLKDYPDIHAVVIGKGSTAVMKRLHQIIEEKQLHSQVTMLGFQPFEHVYSYMKYSGANVIPHHSNGHTDNTIPHKLFQGMMTGRPMLVSSSAPLKRIVNTHASGVVFKASNAEDFAKQALVLYNDADLCARLGRNGMKATLDGPIHWEATGRELASMYANLIPAQ